MSVKSKERYTNKIAGQAFEAPRKGVCGRCGAPYTRGDSIVEYQNFYPRKNAHAGCIFYPVEIRKVGMGPPAPSTRGAVDRDA